jgi:integrase
LKNILSVNPMKIKFYLQRDTKKRKIVGDRRIYCYIYDKPESYEIPTREKVSDKNWDMKKCRPITRGYKNKDEQREMKALSNYLDSFESVVNKTRIEQLTIDPLILPHELKHTIRAKFSPDKSNFFTVYDEYLEDKKNSVAHGTYQKYRNTKNILQDFAKRFKLNLSIHSFDRPLMNKLKLYMNTEKNIADNAAYKNMGFVKTFLNWCFEEQKTENQRYLKFKGKTFQNDVIHLSLKEEDKMFRHKFSSAKLDRVRDVFLFLCYTGQRFSELEKFTRSEIQTDGNNTYWSFTQQKTKMKMNIPLMPKALVILNKYKDTDRPLPKYTNQKFNKYLKEVCKEIGMTQKIKITRQKAGNDIEEVKPKYELIASHSGRRTFVNIAYANGMSESTIKYITGFSDDVMKIYLNKDVISKKANEEMRRAYKKESNLQQII